MGRLSLASRTVLGIAGGALVFLGALIVYGAVDARSEGGNDAPGVVGLVLVVAGIWVAIRAMRPRRHDDEGETQIPTSTWD